MEMLSLITPVFAIGIPSGKTGVMEFDDERNLVLKKNSVRLVGGRKQQQNRNHYFKKPYFERSALKIKAPTKKIRNDR